MSEPVTILLCEDQEVVRVLIRRILVGAGYDVLAAGAPEEALAIAGDSGRTVDALVTDVHMPGMSGPDLARRATAARPGLPVLFVSGSGPEQHDLDEGIGVSALLEKPFAAAGLLAALRELLDRA
jgi:two-component system, cell cycle sensor histidine kinase and response regulator CckA